MTILPGAGAYWFEGNDIGCLLVHGFTGTPQNVRPLADYLARRGLAVSAPRMPGHGTTVEDLDATGPQDWLGAAEDALAELRRRCSTVFVAGISMAAPSRSSWRAVIPTSRASWSWRPRCWRWMRWSRW